MQLLLTAFHAILDTGILEALGTTVGRAGRLRQCRARIVGRAAESASSYIIAIGRTRMLELVSPECGWHGARSKVEHIHVTSLISPVVRQAGSVD